MFEERSVCRSVCVCNLCHKAIALGGNGYTVTNVGIGSVVLNADYGKSHLCRSCLRGISLAWHDLLKSELGEEEEEK